MIVIRLAAVALLLCVSGFALLAPYWLYGYQIEPSIIAKRNALEIEKQRELKEIQHGKFSQKQHANEHQE